MKPRFKKLPISINQRSGIALSDQLHTALTKEINAGNIAIGEQIPSIRELAADLGVTQAVVRKAFDRMIAEGWLEVRHGAGTYVSETAAILVSQTGGTARFYKPETAQAVEQQSLPMSAETSPATPQSGGAGIPPASDAGKMPASSGNLAQRTTPPAGEVEDDSSATWDDAISSGKTGKELANKPLAPKSVSEAAAAAAAWSDPLTAMNPGAKPSPFSLMAAGLIPPAVPDQQAPPPPEVHSPAVEPVPADNGQEEQEDQSEGKLVPAPSPSWDDSWSWTGINPDPISEDQKLTVDGIEEAKQPSPKSDQIPLSDAGSAPTPPRKSEKSSNTISNTKPKRQARQPDTVVDTGKLGALTSLFFDKGKLKANNQRHPSSTSYVDDNTEPLQQAPAEPGDTHLDVDDLRSEEALEAEEQGREETSDDIAVQLGAVANVVAAETAYSTPNFLGLHQSDLRAPVNSADWAKELSQVFANATVYGAPAANQEFELLSTGAESRALVEARWETALRAWIDECTHTTLKLTEPAGMPELREQVANWLRASRGMTCSANDIVIVNGAQEGRDLVARLLIDRGRPVVVEEPGSVMHRAFLQANGANLIPVNSDDSGLIIDELENVQEPALLYVCPSSQFPTGAVLSKNRRLHIIDWASINNSIIVEDDSGCEFTYESRVTSSIHSSDTHDRTIYISSLSHIIPPSWRVGFMVVPKRIRPTLVRLKSLTSRCTSPVVQRLVLKLFESGFMEEQVRKLQRICEQRRQAMLDELKTWPPELATYSPVKSGFLQTIWLPSAVGDVEIYRQCLDKGIAVVPVSPCFLKPPARPGLIINFAATPAEKMAEGLKELRAILEKRNGK